MEGDLALQENLLTGNTTFMNSSTVRTTPPNAIKLWSKDVNDILNDV